MLDNVKYIINCQILICIENTIIKKYEFYCSK